MLLNKNKFIKNEELKNYFEYENKKHISIAKIIFLVMLFLIIFNIFYSIRDIRDIQNYIDENQISQNMNINSVDKNINIENNRHKKINMVSVRKIVETIGVENLDYINISQNITRVKGRTNDLKIVEKLMKNKILKNSYVKKIEGGESYTFEIETGVSK